VLSDGDKVTNAPAEGEFAVKGRTFLKILGRRENGVWTMESFLSDRRSRTALLRGLMVL
jgi:hypothetical protein